MGSIIPRFPPLFKSHSLRKSHSGAQWAPLHFGIEFDILHTHSAKADSRMQVVMMPHSRSWVAALRRFGRK